MRLFSVRWFISRRRVTLPSWECQASFWEGGASSFLFFPSKERGSENC